MPRPEAGASRAAERRRAARLDAYVAVVDVVVEVGGWEHECCGEAIERDQVVDLRCIRHEGPDGRTRLVESHHGGLDVPADEHVRGRVTEIQVVLETGEVRSVLRVPGGGELRDVDELRDGGEDGDGDGDGLLQDPWTGDAIASRSVEFLVTVRRSR